MKIYHVISSLAPHAGGPTSMLLGLAKAQAQSGNHVIIHTTNADLPKGVLDVSTNQPIDNDGYTIWYHALESPVAVCYSSHFAKLLKFEITQFDILHIHGLYRFPVTYAAWLARQNKIPYIISPHGALDPFLYKQSRFGKMAVPIKRLYERLFDIPNLNHASAVHFTSQIELERTQNLNILSPGIIVPNGLDWEEYRELPAKGIFRKRLHLEEKIPLVLFLGRINFKKGLDLLIPAFAKLKETIPLVHLAIVGPDNDGYIQNVVRWCTDFNILDAVTIVDALEKDEVKQAYVDADVFVLPSYTENFGNTVIEALACGCPVVISDQVAIWREIQDSGAGLIVPLDVEKIAIAMQQILENPRLAKEMSDKGKKLIHEKFTWKIIETLFQKHYEEIIVLNNLSRKI